MTKLNEVTVICGKEHDIDPYTCCFCLLEAERTMRKEAVDDYNRVLLVNADLTKAKEDTEQFLHVLLAAYGVKGG